MFSFQLISTYVASSLENHKVLPGIKIGDIGPKAFNAWQATDNGYAVFKGVRIPRESMLSRFSGVSEDGKYLRPVHAKLSYAGVCHFSAVAVGEIN